MPKVNRQRIEPTDEWPRLAERVAWSEQRAYEELRPVVLFGRPVEERAHETGTAERTLYRRVARFDTAGMASLFPPPKVAKHRRLPGEVRRAIVALKAEHPAFRAREIADVCEVRFGHRPSPHTVKRVLAEDPPAPVAHRRFPPYRDIADATQARLAIIRLHSEGWAAKSIAAYLDCSRQQVYRTLRRWIAEGVAGLDDKASSPRQPAAKATLRAIATVKEPLWQADHTQLDLRVVDERGQPARPWLTIIEDDYGRAIAGYYFTFAAPSALGTALALHQAIGRKGDPHWPICGIPSVFYTDHGSDFTSRHLEQVAADLKMQLVFSGAGRPRGRGKIERFFGTVNQLLLCDLPGYAPAGAPPATPTLALADLDACFGAWLLDVYHRRAHGETGEAPVRRWEAGGFLPRLPDSPEQLDLLLLTVAKPRRVHPDGIHFQGLRYLDPTLAAYVGEDVTIRYDPRDLAEIRVFHRDAFLCRAVSSELAGRTIGLKEIVRARDERRRQLRGTLTDRASLVETVLGFQAGRPAPADPPPVPDERPRLKRYHHE